MAKKIRRKVLEKKLEELAAQLRNLDSCHAPDSRYRDVAIDLFYLSKDILADSREKRDSPW